MSEANSTTNVEYREILRFFGYRFGDDGSVWSRWKKVSLGKGYGSKAVLTDSWTRMSVSRRDKNGHYSVNLRTGDSGVKKMCYVHRLILEAFIGPCPDGMEGCHFDDDPSNNRLTNLRWDTPKANKADAFRNGRLHFLRGQEHHASKLSDDQIREIRIIYAGGGATQRQLAKQYNLNQSHVSFIVRGLSWSHLI